MTLLLRALYDTQGTESIGPICLKRLRGSLASGAAVE